MKSAAPVTFVIPCLNESATLPAVLKAIQQVSRGPFKSRKVEILLSDNGSTDGSQRIAQKAGARVVPCAERGYGAALMSGIKNARHEIIVFADADATYNFSEAPRLVAELEKGFDLVIGSRIGGEIKPGAMPWSHRFIGTPILTALINLLYSKGGFRFSDCNSGFRCFRKQSHQSWQLVSDGMEYASEMLVSAMRKGARISEVPVSLSPDTRGRAPHLRRWRDGMRHFIQIFSGAPGFFEASGLVTAALGWGLLLAGYFLGVARLGPMYVLGPHSSLFAMLLCSVGTSVWGAGLLMSARDGSPRGATYRLLLGLGEDRLFWGSVAVISACALMLLAIVAAWSSRGFANINLERETLIVVALVTQLLLLLFNTFTGHLLKRLWRRA